MAGNGWLLVFGEIEGLRWVLRNKRMAFSAATCPRAKKIQPGDELVLYVGRGAFHNPTRDRSQIAGLARVTGPVQQLRKPVVIAGREFACACPIEVGAVLPERQGMRVEPLIPKLSFIKKKTVWGQYLRAGLVELPDGDLRLIRSALRAAPTSV